MDVKEFGPRKTGLSLVTAGLSALGTATWIGAPWWTIGIVAPVVVAGLWLCCRG